MFQTFSDATELEDVMWHHNLQVLLPSLGWWLTLVTIQETLKILFPNLALLISVYHPGVALGDLSGVYSRCLSCFVPWGI